MMLFEEDVMRGICKYAPQSDRSLKKCFNELRNDLDMHSFDVIVVYLCDFSGHW